MTSDNWGKLLTEHKALFRGKEQEFEADFLSLTETKRSELCNLRAQVAEQKCQREAVQPLPKTEVNLSQFVQKSDPDIAFHTAQIENHLRLFKS